MKLSAPEFAKGNAGALYLGFTANANVACDGRGRVHLLDTDVSKSVFSKNRSGISGHVSVWFLYARDSIE